jgi:hypothetical protein
MKKHKNCEAIVAWANGYAIQCQSPTTFEWYDIPNIDDLDKDDNFLCPHPVHPDYSYMDFRINPLQEKI